MDRIGTTGGNGKDKDTGGRKDANKQEAVPDKGALKAAIPGVKKVLEELKEAQDKANKKIKAVAKSSGFLAKVVRAAATADMGEEETFEEAKRYSEQMALAFEALDR
jgi:uncharacterized protein (UPF0335 family)